MKILFIIGLIIVAFLVREGRENQNYGTKNRGAKEKDYDAMTFFHPMENETRKQTERISKDAADYRKEGLELEQQGKYEEAFMKYEEAAKMEDTKSMLLIARMYMSGDFRPVDSLNLPQSLLQGGPVFPWDLQIEKRPDNHSALEWLIKAADLGDALACETAGIMICKGVGCEEDIDKGISYLEKAVANGDESARKYICLFRPDGKALSDSEYETCLTEFEKAAEAKDEKAYELYATLKSGTQKQLARLGHILIAAQNVRKNGFEEFNYSSTPSGIPLIPVVSKRVAWRTFLRFNLDAWIEENPLIAIASDILPLDEPFRLLSNLHHAKFVGTMKYRSPNFGWLHEEKEAVLIRLDKKETLNEKDVKIVADSFFLTEEEYRGESIAFMVEDGEKEYSLEIAGVRDNKVEVLWRYSIGGSVRINDYFEPQLISIEINE